ncbi:MAG: DUF6194 family protein [Alphaproteobacteria bacterium]|nr:DUF6194 family protein [Alphaproteobacteria bacterium]
MIKTGDVALSIDYLTSFILENYKGIQIIDAWGEKSFFYNPNAFLKRGVYFCTLKEKDGANDKASMLNRDGVYRLNFGISKQTFLRIFSWMPKRPSKGDVIEGVYDFTQVDLLTPHPVYGWMAWVSISNPSMNSFEKIKDLIDESYTLVLEKYKKRISI